MNPFLLTDFYKVGHLFQYPKGTEYVYSNFTPRSNTRMPEIDKMVFFGLQMFCVKYLQHYFDQKFFNLPKTLVISQYKRIIKNALGSDLPSYKHLEDLHDLGYLPVLIKAVPEGTAVPMRVPCMTIINTDPRFYWLTNFLETLMSCSLWQACTSASIARRYRVILDSWARFTGMHPDFVQWQGHDFSFRGLSSLESATVSGMGHLLSFSGTDTIPAICELESYYGANSDIELIGGSVPATEHSVMCSGGQGDEINTIRRLITETYPTGIVSIVSDTWDLWKVLTEYLPALKNEIMNRPGKLVIRPDSGDPVKIICGDPYPEGPAREGVVQLLWNIFGGTVTDKGFKLLDEHVGVIYGDSITIGRADEICLRLVNKGFASQTVFGIGSYTYQNNTRDSFGTAIKATWVQINGKGQAISKDPVTDDGTKKSASGLLMVDEHLVLHDNCTPAMEQQGILRPVFRDGRMLRYEKLKDIRERVAKCV